MSVERFGLLRRLEAILFASAEPLSENILLSRLPEGTELGPLLEDLQGQYANRGVNLVQRGKGWAFRTAPDMAPFFTLEREIPRKLSRAAVETMAIIAYQQPVTRAEIEEIRGVALSKGTLDILLEAGWIKPKGRRKVPGRPITWGTTEPFLDYFGLEALDALPGIDELKAAGLLDRRAGVSSIAMREDDLFQGDREEDEEDMENFLEATLDEDEESGDVPGRADLSRSDG
ncbi:MAG: SMC-Scp complex subunit ScpB [Proteobacteria bacterium]|nr:SMC-Scp complex subunit ScpB [Pseudomonadota bacterium]